MIYAGVAISKKTETGFHIQTYTYRCRNEQEIKAWILDQQTNTFPPSDGYSIAAIHVWEIPRSLMTDDLISTVASPA